jgi:hypothetical protein
MERNQKRNFVKVNEIDPSPTIYEELGNGKLRVVDLAEFGIKPKPVQEKDPNNFPVYVRRNQGRSSAGFGPAYGPLTIHEEMEDGRLRVADPAEFGIKAAKVVPQLG